MGSGRPLLPLRGRRWPRVARSDEGRQAGRSRDEGVHAEPPSSDPTSSGHLAPDFVGRRGARLREPPYGATTGITHGITYCCSATSRPSSTVRTMLCTKVRENTRPSWPLRSVTETPVAIFCGE